MGVSLILLCENAAAMAAITMSTAIALFKYDISIKMVTSTITVPNCAVVKSLANGLVGTVCISLLAHIQGRFLNAQWHYKGTTPSSFSLISLTGLILITNLHS